MDGFDGNIELGVKLTPTDIKKTASQLRREIEGVFEGSAGKKTSKQFQRMETQLDRLYGRSEKLHRSLKELEDTKLPTAEYKAVEKEFDAVSNSIQKTGKLIEDLQAKLDASSTSRNRKAAIATQIEAQEKELERLYVQLDKVEAKRDALKASGKDYVSGTETQEYRNTANELNNVNNQIVQVISAVNKLRSDEEGLPEPIKKTSKATETLRSSMSKVLTVVEKVVKAYGKMLLLIGKGLVSGAKRLLGHFGALNKYTDKHQLSLKRMTKMLLKYGLGIRSLFILWRKLRGYVTETIKAMAKQFSDVNADVSMLMNAFNQMKASFGSMAQPLLHALAPALTYIINLITAALNALGNFFAILTRQKFVYKATKQNKDYAASVGAVGGAAKEANKELAEYDNLIVIQQDSGSGGGGGGAAADAYAGAWEKVEAESDFAKQLREAIDAGDWEGIGSLLAEKLNTLTKKFDDWINNVFRPKGVEWAKRIAKILGSLTENWDSELTGRTIADTLMTYMDIVATFFETYPWKTLGQKVTGLINGIFTDWEPKTVARWIAGKFNAVIRFLSGLVDREKGINWKLLGSKIGQTLKQTIEDIEWKDLGADLSGLASGILTTLSTAIVESQLGKTVGEAINQFLSGIDFGQLASDLSDLAINILDALADCIITINWHDVGDAIADFLKNIKWADFLTKLIEVAKALIGGLATALVQIATDPEALGSLAEGLLIIFGSKFIWGKIKNLFKTNLGTAISEGAAAAGTSGATSGAAATGGLIGTIKSGLGVTASGVGIGAAFGGLSTGAGLVAAAGTGIASLLAGKIGLQVGSGLGGLLSYWLGAPDDLVDEYLKEAQAPFDYLINNIGDIFAGAGQLIYDDLIEPVKNIGSDMITAVGDGLSNFGDFLVGGWAEIIESLPDLEPGELFNTSATTGKTYITNMFSEMFGGKSVLEQAAEQNEARMKQSELEAERARLGWSKEKGGVGREVTDTEWFAYKWGDTVKEMQSVSEDAFFGVGASLKFLGDSLESTVESGRKSLGILQSDSNHYAEIAKSTAKSVQDTTKMAEDSSNHYAEIAKANAGYSENLKKEAIDSSNHYAEIAKQNAGYYDQIQQQMIDSSNHYADIAKANAQKVQEDAEQSFAAIGFAGGMALNDVSTKSLDAKNVIVGAMEEAKTKSSAAFEGMEGEFTNMSDGIKTSVDTVPDAFDNTFTNAYNKITGVFDATKTYFQSVAEGVKTPFGTMADFFHDTFSDSWSGVVDVFQTDTPQFQSIQDSISGSFKTMINGMITGVNNSISSPFQTLSNLVSRLKGMTVGDNKIFSALPSITVPKIPKLAQGAVLPPNNPFIAMVGDQKQGTNVEAPLDTIAEALRQVLSESKTTQNQTIVLQLNGRQIAQAVWDEENKRYKQTGARFSYS